MHWNYCYAFWFLSDADFVWRAGGQIALKKQKTKWTDWLYVDCRRLGNNTSPAERASSEGRTVTSLTNHGHAHESEANYSHPFQHMLHQHSGWSTVDGSSGTGPIAGGGVETGSASSLASSSSNEGIPASGNIQQSNSPSHIDAYHGEKYKYDRLNEADGNADNRFLFFFSTIATVCAGQVARFPLKSD